MTDSRTMTTGDGERVGEVVDDRYRLEAYLGGGGMGEVYRAEHKMMHKTVAVKILRPAIAGDDSIVERFRREAEAAAHLDHPNICSATDFGESEDGDLYLVMEFVSGENLRDLIDRKGELPLETILAVADGVAAGLEKAHQLDIVHRDIKPDNVMLVDDPASNVGVKVLDFGVAHVELGDNTPSLTKTGAVFGTPSCMAPEQAAGDEVDHRADLYGLGAVLYEMATGREMFDVDDPSQLMSKQIMETPSPPSEVRRTDRLPPALEQLIMRLLAKEPDARPQSAPEVRRELDAIAGGNSREEESAGPPRGSLARRFSDTLQGLSVDLVKDKTANNPLQLLAIIVLGGLTLSFVVLLAAVLYFSGGEDPAEVRASLAKQRDAFAERREVASTIEALESGRPGSALEKFEALKEESKGEPNPHLEYYLGRARADVGKWSGSIASYQRAVEHDDRYLYDEELVEDVVDAFVSRKEERHEMGRDFLRRFVDYHAISSKLGTLAWQADSGRARDRAYEVLEETGALGDLEEWQRLSVKLRRADNCDDYEKYISALVEHGDPRGIGILEIYQAKKRTGCGPRFLKFKDCYKCIRDDLDDAIEVLEKSEDDES